MFPDLGTPKAGGPFSLLDWSSHQKYFGLLSWFFFFFDDCFCSVFIYYLLTCVFGFVRS